MPRINLLFILIILLTACTPNATLAPLPTATSSPMVTEAAAIDMHPAGFDMAPTDSSNSSSELFVTPTTEDAKIHTSGEAEIPESINEVIRNYKDEMVKLIPEVAEVCVVPAADVKLVFKEGTVGDQYRWTMVYEAGQYTCWSTVESTGQLGEYPSYFDKTGRIKGHADRVSWERLEGKMAWAGTVPVLITNSSYIVPEGLNGSQVNTPDNWSALEAKAGESVTLIPNPISPENMNLLTAGGYRWDSTTGSLKTNAGEIVLTINGDKWVDPVTGSEIVDFRAVLVNGVDYQGNAIGSLPTRVFNGEPQVFNPDIGNWVRRIDLTPGQTMMDVNGVNNALDGAHWGTFENITLEGIPTITQEEAENGTLFYNEQLALRAWPENVTAPKLQCAKFNTGNYWYLSQFPSGYGVGSFYTGNVNRAREPGETPITWENDGIKNVAVVKYQDGTTGEWNIKQGLQYWVGGKSVVLNVRYWGENADPTNPEFINTQMALTNPRWNVVMPWCNESQVRPLLPQALQQKMAEEDVNPTPPVGDGQTWTPMTFDIDSATMARLQGITFEDAYMERNLLGYYLVPLSDPAWKEIFPEMDVPGN